MTKKKPYTVAEETTDGVIVAIRTMNDEPEPEQPMKAWPKQDDTFGIR